MPQFNARLTSLQPRTIAPNAALMKALTPQDPSKTMENLAQTDAYAAHADAYSAQAKKHAAETAEIERVSAWRADPNNLNPLIESGAGFTPDEATAFREGRPEGLDPNKVRAAQQLKAVLGGVAGLDKPGSIEDWSTAIGNALRNGGVQQALAAAASDPNTALVLSSIANKTAAPKLYDNLPDGLGTFSTVTGDSKYDPAMKGAAVGLTNAKAGTEVAKQGTERAHAGYYGAAAGKERAHAGLYTEQTRGERAENAGIQNGVKPEKGFRWTPTGLEPIPGGSADPAYIRTKTEAEGKGAAKPEKVTDTERLASGYAGRMVAATELLDANEGKGKPGPLTATIGAIVPGAFGKFAERMSMTPEQQKYRQAAEDWVRAKLRKESGAVIGDEEMAREIATYFPMVGDGDAVRAQKREARKVATQAMIETAGPGWAVSSFSKKAPPAGPTDAGAPKTPASPVASAPSGNAFDAMPDAAQFKGKTITDTETGKRFISDGKGWRPL